MRFAAHPVEGPEEVVARRGIGAGPHPPAGPHLVWTGSLRWHLPSLACRLGLPRDSGGVTAEETWIFTIPLMGETGPQKGMGQAQGHTESWWLS